MYIAYRSCLKHNPIMSYEVKIEHNSCINFRDNAMYGILKKYDLYRCGSVQSVDVLLYGVKHEDVFDFLGSHTIELQENLYKNYKLAIQDLISELPKEFYLLAIAQLTDNNSSVNYLKLKRMIDILKPCIEKYEERIKNGQ